MSHETNDQINQFQQFLSNPLDYFTTVEEQELYQDLQLKITKNLNQIIALVFDEKELSSEDTENYRYLLLKSISSQYETSDELDEPNDSPDASGANCSLFEKTIQKWNLNN